MVGPPTCERKDVMSEYQEKADRHSPDAHPYTGGSDSATEQKRENRRRLLKGIASAPVAATLAGRPAWGDTGEGCGSILDSGNLSRHGERLHRFEECQDWAQSQASEEHLDKEPFWGEPSPGNSANAPGQLKKK